MQTNGDQTEGARTYEAEFFGHFSPRNALDMLRQVPGFSVRQSQEQRGLGEASGNVLLNGQRISGKSDDIIAAVSRIPAQNVIRIEVVDAASFDIPGLSGQVANIIARAGALSGQFAWRPEFRSHFSEPLLTRFDASISGRRGPVQYTFALANEAQHGGAGGPTRILAPDLSLIEDRHEVVTSQLYQPQASARFAFDGPSDSGGNLNLSYRRYWRDIVEEGLRTRPDEPPRQRGVKGRQDGYNYEISGDYAFGIGPGRLKLIGISRFTHELDEITALVSLVDERPFGGTRFALDSDESEQIARAEYGWRALGGDWQVSGEGAFNSLDAVSNLFTLDRDGNFGEIPLPGGSSRVEEHRYQAMTSYGRQVSPNFSYQLALGGEFSELAQAGDQGVRRDFWRPKGQASGTWRHSENLGVTFKLERQVGQLNFSDFLASVNLTDDRKVAANPDLVPPQSWVGQIEMTRRFGAWGNHNLRVYGHLIDDIVDNIPIGDGGEAVGNIDTATRYGVEWTGTVNFDPIGWRGAKLDGRVQFQDSRLTDPLTGEARPISRSVERWVDFTLRHDIPSTQWAWGSQLWHVHQAPDVRLTEFGTMSTGPVMARLFVEHKDVMGLTVRADVNNLLDARNTWERTVFVDRRDGPVAFVEKRDRMIGTVVSFSISGRF